MKEKKREIEESKITGFFDKDTEIKGDLKFKGTFRIDGRFKGNISSPSVLIIGDSGKVEADIKIGHIVINGEIKGNIQASDRVEINSSGKIFGTIISPKLIVEDGAYLEASCQTSSEPQKTSSSSQTAEKENKDLGPKP
jgi:cytoskeletal protein CcmA (bactofilin family)